MKYNNKKVISYFELIIVVVSIFSMAHFLDSTSVLFENLSIDEVPKNLDNNLFFIKKNFFNFAIKKLNKPLFKIVSAEENFEGAGCCEETIDGTACATSTVAFCAPDAFFAENLHCSSASFCKKGCCYDELLGIYDKNVLESACSSSWVGDPNCNFPAAYNGCCVLGDSIQFETYGQCVVDTEELALGDGIVDWRGDLTESQCFQIPFAHEKGACVLAGGSCSMNTQETCSSIGGNFAKGFLCTSQDLNTICIPTTETTCVDSLYGVYFLDSCGNTGNIYDSSKVNDQSYWENIIPLSESCGGTSESGNANNPDCGNCNLFLGGICSNAIIDDFNVDYGINYCRDVSCSFEGENYENGESFCGYDGKIGDGDDVVGSRHFKYVCNQGDVQIEPCEDYRNEICVQQNTEVDGEIVYRNANCIPNNWRACLTINSESENRDELIEDCNSAVNCEITDISIADHFAYPVCTPKYPGGFDVRDERYQDTTELICGKATQTCTVYREQKFFGGCKYVANEACLGSGFGEQMNDLCTSLGDCGGGANYVGDFEKNYLVKGSPDLSSAWIAKLTKYAEPIAGQYAPLENYDEYLKSAGILPFEIVSGEDIDKHLSTLAQGLSGVSAAIGIAIKIGYISSSAVTISPAWATTFNVILGTNVQAGAYGTSFLAAFAGSTIGAALGAYAGLFLAKELGLSPFGTLLMAVGGALVGGVIGYYAVIGTLGAIPVIGWAILIVGFVLLIFGAFFGGSSCDQINVSFQCNPWQPESGGDKCEECNNDPDRPCSKYSCETLGAGCQFLNYDADSEEFYVCANSCQNNPNPPIIEPQLEFITPGLSYSSVTDSGFKIVSENSDGCVPANTNLQFGITTEEPSLCKIDITRKEFDEMNYNMGGNFYLYNHTMFFPVPDPSQGISQGLNWDGQLEFFVKCQDSCGYETPNFYKIEMCVNQGDDVFPPSINRFNPESNSLVSFDSDEAFVSIMTNELATCKWDTTDKEYSLMNNEFSCDDSFGLQSSPFGYVCDGQVSTTESINSLFVRCGDQPWLVGTANESERNFMNVGEEYILKKPDKKIEIDYILPNVDFAVPTEITSIDLQVQTSGGGLYHYCSYSFSGYDTMIPFFETGLETLHVQPALNLQAGNWEMFIECHDELNEVVQSQTNFEIIYDDKIPQIARVWQEFGEIFIITEEPAECKYAMTSCSFDWEDATVIGTDLTHIIDAELGRTYFVRCSDEFGNMPNACSVSVVAV